MDLRKPNIALAITTVMMVVGALWVGPGASDTEIKLICWPALGVGSIILLVLEIRGDDESDEHSPSPRRR